MAHLSLLAQQIFWVFFILGLCVFSHELGHFLAAKLSHMRVTEFAFGLGPLLYGRRRGETLYAIRAVPFGGQVQIVGMEPGEEDVPGGFHTRPRWQRLATILAGVFMNVVLAMILFWIVAVVHGVPLPDREATVIGKAFDGEPAQAAGLAAGDRIVALDGNRQNLLVTNVAPGSVAARAGLAPGHYLLVAASRDLAVPQDLVAALRDAPTGVVRIGAVDMSASDVVQSIGNLRLPRLAVTGQLTPVRAVAIARERLGLTFAPLDQMAAVRYLSLRPDRSVAITVLRGSAEVTRTVQCGSTWGRLETITAQGQLDAPHRRTGRIGILLVPPTQRVGIVAGLVLGAVQSYSSVRMVIESIRGMASRKIAAEPTGPIGIMKLTAERVIAGWAAVLTLGGFISANLAVINLFPIPPFDGFHIALITYEGIIQRRIRAQPETVIRLAGIFLLVVFFAWLVAKDITNLIMYGTP